MSLQWQYFILFNGCVVFLCIYIPHLLYPFLCRWTNCFHVLVIVISAAMNIAVWISLWIIVFSGRRMVVLFLFFKGASILFSIVAVPVYIPTNRKKPMKTQQPILELEKLRLREIQGPHLADQVQSQNSASVSGLQGRLSPTLLPLCDPGRTQMSALKPTSGDPGQDWADVYLCDGSFHASVWPGYKMPSYLAKHDFWVGLWGISGWD